jgi:hypothetical protein
MNKRLPHPAIAIAAFIFTTDCLSQNVVETVSTPPSKTPTTIYRQVTPDGRIVYSDKAMKNAKIDQTITVEPPVTGNLWTSEPGARPNLPQKIEHTKIIKAPFISPEEKQRIADQAESGVIRAEMLLEDAKRAQKEGIEPLPGERTGNVDGKSRLNEQYFARQKALAKAVAYAEANLQRARDREAALR